MDRTARRSRRHHWRAASIALAVSGLLAGPLTSHAAPLQYMRITASQCAEATLETNVLPPPNVWAGSWTCVATGVTNTNVSGQVAGTVQVTYQSDVGTDPCSSTATVDMSVKYTDPFGLTVSFEATAMPYKPFGSPAFFCKTDYPSNGRIAPTVLPGAYSGMDEVCQFSVVGEDAMGTNQDDLFRFSMDNQASTAPCTLSS